MNYDLLLECVQHTIASQRSALGGVNPELFTLADELVALADAEPPVVEEAPTNE